MQNANEPDGDEARRRPFVFDVATIPGRTNAELLGDAENADHLLELLGRDLVTRVLVQTPELCVYHETAKPGEHVEPHRHGTYQVDYVLRGELVFGNQRVTAGKKHRQQLLDDLFLTDDDSMNFSEQALVFLLEILRQRDVRSLHFRFLWFSQHLLAKQTGRGTESQLD